MNTLTKNPRKAKAKALELANMRQEPVWMHLSSTLTYWVDYVPGWWTEREVRERTKAGEIVAPGKLAQCLLA
jgi:hypothetical protein